MKQHLAAIALLVPDYDSAIAYFTAVLGFDLISDTLLDAATGKRWVQVAPPGAQTRILLAKAATAAQTARVGDQTGGRVFLFLETDDFWRDYRLYNERGVAFTEAPRREAYGTVVVFQDILGNKWDLVEFTRS
jgi:catechol 2,3-dioxygenase-like lactoylglutathione lyase family enzyme